MDNSALVSVSGEGMGEMLGVPARKRSWWKGEMGVPSCYILYGLAPSHTHPLGFSICNSVFSSFASVEIHELCGSFFLEGFSFVFSFFLSFVFGILFP